MMQVNLIQFFLAGILFFTGCQKENNDPPGENGEAYAQSISKPELTVYEAPGGAPTNYNYSVLVRYDGGEWIDLHEYDAGVDGGFDEQPLGHMAFVYFDSDFSKRIDVKVEKRSGSVNDVRIRPESAGISFSDNGNEIEFSLTEPRKLSVEFNGDKLNNLAIFANELETNIPDSTDANVHYFGPGIHKIGENGRGELSVESGETVYIAGGAIVYGSIRAADPSYKVMSDITIRGRGILSGDMRETHPYTHPDRDNAKGMIFLGLVNDATIEGIILHNTVKWNVHFHYCNRIETRNLKILSWTINSDGINPSVSSDILIDDCFIRNHDDCVSIKLSWFQGAIQPPGAKNITIRNSVFWTDQGRAILIGPELASSMEKKVENIAVKNMDILYTENYSSANTDWAKGVLAINAGDDVTVRNVLYEDIRVDELGKATNLVTINMVKTPYSASEGKRVENIRFNRVTLNSKPTIDNFIHGYSADRIISGVYFTDLMIEGDYVSNPEEGYFDINGFTEDIEFNVTD